MEIKTTGEIQIRVPAYHIEKKWINYEEYKKLKEEKETLQNNFNKVENILFKIEKRIQSYFDLE